MKTKAVAASIAVLLAGVGAYWYWSPVIALKQMRSAALAGDADSFNERVDYPRLRESFKGQMSAMMTKRMAEQPAPGNDYAKAGAALGAMLGMAMVNSMVDALVRPEVVMRAMQGRVVPPDPAGSGGPDAGSDVVWSSERAGVDKYIVFGAKPDDAPENRLGLVLERAGFASWRLTEVLLPAALPRTGG